MVRRARLISSLASSAGPSLVVCHMRCIGNVICVVSGVLRPGSVVGGRKSPIAGAFPIQPLGRSRPTLAGRLLYGDCIALSCWAVPLGTAQRASATYRHATADAVAAQSS